MKPSTLFSCGLLSLLAACASSAHEGPPGMGGRTGSDGTSATGGSAGAATTAGTGGRTVAGGSGGAAGTGGAAGSGGSRGVGGRTGTGGRTVSDGGPDANDGAARGGRSGAGGSMAMDGGGDTGGATHTGQWQIMPLGDSITGTTCYPKLLAQKLADNGHTNFTFVGTVLNNQGCGSAANVQTEGHSCYLVTNLTKDVTPVPDCGGTKGTLTELKAWAAEKPEVVLMEYGTNDCWSSIATSTITAAFSAVVDEFRKQKPDVIFFVAQLTPLNPSGCTTCEANVEALNQAIPGWAKDKGTATSPIHVVDIGSSVGPAASYKPGSTYTDDGCHPNPAGSQKMADKWYEALLAQGIP